MEKITNKEAIFLILTIMINNIVLVCSQIVVETCSSSSILNAIYISTIIFFISYIICLLYKNFSGQNILDISEFLGGKILKILVGFIFLGYFIFTISILLRRITDCLQLVYFPLTNIIYLVLLFLIATGTICNLKNNCISKANYIITPIVLTSIILVFLGNVQNFDFQSIYPILGNGIDSTFFYGLSNLFCFSGLAYIYFLPSRLERPEKLTKVTLISVLLSAIFFILTIASILFMFDNTFNASELFPLYLAVRYIEFGTFFQRLDSAFLLIWVISFIGLLSIITNLCINIFKELSHLSNERPLIYPILLSIFSISLIIKNNSILEFIENYVFKILFFAIVLGLGILILVFANIKKKLLKGAKNE